MSVLLSLLASTSEYVRLNAAFAIASVCWNGHTQNQTAFTVVEGSMSMNMLVSLLRDTKEDMRRSAALAIASVCWNGHTQNQTAFGAVEESINALVLLLRDTNEDVRRNAALAIASVCWNGHIQNQTAFGAVEESINALVLLLRDTNEDVRRNAALAIASVCWNGHTQNQMAFAVVEGSMSELVSLLEDTDEGVRRDAVLAVGSTAFASNAPLDYDILGQIKACAGSDDAIFVRVAALYTLGSVRLEDPKRFLSACESVLVPASDNTNERERMAVLSTLLCCASGCVAVNRASGDNQHSVLEYTLRMFVNHTTILDAALHVCDAWQGRQYTDIAQLAIDEYAAVRHEWWCIAAYDDAMITVLIAICHGSSDSIACQEGASRLLRSSMVWGCCVRSRWMRSSRQALAYVTRALLDSISVHSAEYLSPSCAPEDDMTFTASRLRLQRIAAKLEALSSDSEQAIAALRTLRQNLRYMSIALGFCGPSNAGKTKLMSTRFEQLQLPRTNAETTGIPLRIRLIQEDSQLAAIPTHYTEGPLSGFCTAGDSICVHFRRDRVLPTEDDLTRLPEHIQDALSSSAHVVIPLMEFNDISTASHVACPVLRKLCSHAAISVRTRVETSVPYEVWCTHHALSR
jgi:HEAT repeat protein